MAFTQNATTTIFQILAAQIVLMAIFCPMIMSSVLRFVINQDSSRHHTSLRFGQSEFRLLISGAVIVFITCVGALGAGVLALIALQIVSLLLGASVSPIISTIVIGAVLWCAMSATIIIYSLAAAISVVEGGFGLNQSKALTKRLLWPLSLYWAIYAIVAFISGSILIEVSGFVGQAGLLGVGPIVGNFIYFLATVLELSLLGVFIGVAYNQLTTVSKTPAIDRWRRAPAPGFGTGTMKPTYSATIRRKYFED